MRKGTPTKKKRLPTRRENEAPGIAHRIGLAKIVFPAKCGNVKPLVCVHRIDQKGFQVTKADESNYKVMQKTTRVPQRQIILCQANTLMLGTDQRLYNLLEKSISRMMLMQIKGDKQPTQEDTPASAVKATSCNCRKSQCLKLYCECFSVNEFCTERCQCQGCRNIEGQQHERQRAITMLKSRNGVFQLQEDEDSVGLLKYPRGCNCKKSGCKKKYCECYQLGLKCTEACKCRDCCNVEPIVKQDVFREFAEFHAHQQISFLSRSNDGAQSVAFSRLLELSKQ